MNFRLSYKYLIYRLLLLNIFILYFVTAFSQNKKDSLVSPFSLSFKYHNGLIMSREYHIYNLTRNPVTGFEIGFNLPTWKNKTWAGFYNYPEWGFSFFHYNLGNPKQLGFGNGLASHLNFTGWKFQKINLLGRIGFGMIYIDKTFNVDENFKNGLIGSKLNVILHSSVLLRIKLYKGMRAEGGISFCHFSNGEYQLPNGGINTLTFNAGISWQPIQYEVKDYEKFDKKKYNNKWHYNVNVAGGKKETLPVGGKKYSIFEAINEITFDINNYQSIGASIDFIYDKSGVMYFESKMLDYEKSEFIRLGANSNYQLKFNRLIFIVSTGIYFRNEIDNLKNQVYNRFGGRFFLTNNLFLTVTHKSHFFFKGDYVAWGIGYRFI